MTLSTQTPTQNSIVGRPRRRGSRLFAMLGLGIAAVAGLGTWALTSQSTYGPVDTPVSAYARPTPALHGQTLAVYVAARDQSAHEARMSGLANPALRTKSLR